jgi:transcriptional regulator with XRE-family HTH domain
MRKTLDEPSIRAQSKQYFAALGAYVAQRRKSLGYTQAELARAIGVSQQAVFAYELGERRISVIVLTKVAKALRVGVEEMIGLQEQSRARKPRLSPRALRHAERLQALPKTAQRFVIKIITTLEERGGHVRRH